MKNKLPMGKKIKKSFKKEKTTLSAEISSLKKSLSDYKAERKANWKTFKSKMHDDISKLKKLIN
jgi:uncharacterized protein YlxW (UPF0749 family)